VRKIKKELTFAEASSSEGDINTNLVQVDFNAFFVIIPIDSIFVN
jgi:hypothetical protein